MIGNTQNYKTYLLFLSGPEQIRPRKFEDALKSNSFKRDLPSFLINEW